MNNIIFLDIDGVLNSFEHLNSLDKKDFSGCPIAPFSSTCINNILYVIEKTKAKVVISSARRGYGVSGLSKIFKSRGIDINIIDVTPDGCGKRGHAIEKWLSDNKGRVDNYVIIDDDNLMLDSQKNNFVMTTFLKGFTQKDALKCVDILLNKK